MGWGTSEPEAYNRQESSRSAVPLEARALRRRIRVDGPRVPRVAQSEKQSPEERGNALPTDPSILGRMPQAACLLRLSVAGSLGFLACLVAGLLLRRLRGHLDALVRDRQDFEVRRAEGEALRGAHEVIRPARERLDAR